MATTTVDPTVVVLDVLNQFSNYTRWNLAVKKYLQAEDLWDVTTEPPKEGDELERKTWRKNDARALRIIQNCCGTYYINFVSEAGSAKDAWDTIAKMCEPVFIDIPADDIGSRAQEVESIHDRIPNLRKPKFLAQARIPNLRIPNLRKAKFLAQDRIPEFLLQSAPSKEPNADTQELLSIDGAKPDLRKPEFLCQSAPIQKPNADTHIQEFVSIDDSKLKPIKEERQKELVSNDDRKLKEIKVERSSDAAIDGNIGPSSDTQKLVSNDDGKPKNECIAFHNAVLNKEMDIVEQLFDAVLTKETNIVVELVDLMKEEDLEIIDKSGFTAFYYAVNMNDFEKAKCMVEKNNKLPTIVFPPDGALPVLWAYVANYFDLARYLYHKTPLEDLKTRSGAELISQSFTKNEVDIAWDLIRRCPGLAVATDIFGHSPLNALAGMRGAFLSGERLKFWEQWIYDSISIKSTLTMCSEANDVRINVRKEETDEGSQRNISLSGTGSLGQLATSLLRLLVPGPYKRISQKKLVHVQCRAFLHFMCVVTKNKNLEERQNRFVQSAIFRAVERGHMEFIRHFLKEYPECKEMTDAKGMNMFQYAVECRQDKVYSLIYESDERTRRNLMHVPVDKLNNSVLHLVGRLPPHGQLDHIKDAALRMQRELQWFKEVESIAPQNAGDIMNFTDNMTPNELFTKNHKELKKEGEKSLKGTATSCTVVGALIITIMFAAAFTVPSGKNGETGIPNPLYKKLVMVYLVSDAISLYSSSTSVIIFLGILTSGYEEVDFLKSLPRKMIFGLLTLFLAVTTMMITFSCAIYIMFEGKSETSIPVILLGAIPVLTFVLMQFGLLKEMTISTYGAGIFRKN